MTLLGDLLMQQHIIAALILRDLAERIGHGRFGVALIFAEPLLLGTTITLFHSVISPREFADILTFFSVGYLMFYMLRSIMNRASGAVQAMQMMLYHQRVTLLSIFIARHLVEMVLSLGVLAVFLLAGAMVGAMPPSDPLKILGAFALIAVMSQGVAFLLIGLTHTFPTLERGAHMVSYIFLPTSGVFFILDNIPPVIRDVLVWFPFALAFDLLRDGQYGERYNYHYDVNYMLLWSLILTFFGLCCLRIVRRNLQAE